MTYTSNRALAGLLSVLLALSTLSAAPEEPAQTRGDEVTVTSELALRQEVSEDDQFSVVYGVGSPMPGGVFGGSTKLFHATLCAPTPTRDEPGVRPCERGGLYRSAITLRRGSVIKYSFARRGKPLAPGRSEAESFRSKVVGEDTTIRVSFPTGERVPERLPEVGEGGGASSRAGSARPCCACRLSTPENCDYV